MGREVYIRDLQIYRMLCDLWSLLQEMICWVFVFRNLMWKCVDFWSVTQSWKLESCNKRQGLL